MLQGGHSGGKFSKSTGNETGDESESQKGTQQSDKT